MKILDVKLVTHHGEPDKEGNLIPVLTPYFVVTPEDEELPFIVPFDPMNMDYVAVREWYEGQKKKPFKFDFENAKPE